MKTTVKKLAAGTFIALILLAGNVKAEGTEIKATSLKIIETELQLEDWMTNESFWNTNTYNIADFAQETETNMELERWMTNDKIWNLNNNFVIETEAGMQLESWMTSEETWNVGDMNFEAELTVEDWMIDSEVWK